MATKYRVRNQLISYPTDARVVERLLNGEHFTQRAVPIEGEDTKHRLVLSVGDIDDVQIKHAREGDIVDDIPACSIAELLREGLIEVVTTDATEPKEPVAVPLTTPGVPESLVPVPDAQKTEA